jgi:hypothetical protein
MPFAAGLRRTLRRSASGPHREPDGFAGGVDSPAFGDGSTDAAKAAAAIEHNPRPIMPTIAVRMIMRMENLARRNVSRALAGRQDRGGEFQTTARRLVLGGCYDSNRAESDSNQTPHLIMIIG